MKNENIIHTKRFITDEEGSFSAVYGTFSNSQVDLERTTSRSELFSYNKNAEKPILYRHYKHRHNDDYGFDGYTQNTLEYCKMYIFVEGKIGMVANDNLYITKFGKIITMRTGEKTAVIFNASENLEYFELDFPMEFFDSLPETSPFHKIFFTRNSIDNNSLDLDSVYTEKMFRIFTKLDSVIEENSEYKDMLVYSYLIQLFSTICEGIYNNASEDTIHKLPPTLKIALNYISENYLTLNDTKQIADYCHISVSYLCRMFKIFLGLSPIEYINSQKLSKAKHLLKNGHNVTESCYASGFNSYNYFISAFKKYVGQTPTEFQKSETKKD